MSVRTAFIFGAGGFAREVEWAIRDGGTFSRLRNVVDAEYLDRQPQCLSFDQMEATFQQDDAAFLGVGAIPLRRKFIEQADFRYPLFPPLAHKSATLARGASLNYGVYIGPGSVVSCGVYFEPFVLVNQCCSVGHDVTIRLHSVICPGCILSGGVTVGRYTFLGSGVIVYPGVKIGDGCTVSAGTVVSKDLPDGFTEMARPNLVFPPREKKTQEVSL